MKETKKYAVSLFDSLCLEAPLLFADTFRYILTKAGETPLDVLVSKNPNLLKCASAFHFDVNYIECKKIFQKGGLCFDTFLFDVDKNHKFLHPALNRIRDICVSDLGFNVESINQFLTENVLYTECIGGPSYGHMLLNILELNIDCNISSFGLVQLSNLCVLKKFDFDFRKTQFGFVTKMEFKNGTTINLLLFAYNGLIRYCILNYELLFPRKMTMYGLIKWLTKQSKNKDENEDISNYFERSTSESEIKTIQIG